MNIKGIIQNRIIKFIYSLSNIPYDLYCLIFHKQDTIVVDSWTKFIFGRLIPNNWGDDLNYYFVKDVFHKKVIFSNSSLIWRLFDKKKYCLIGSILGKNINDDLVVWGSGANLDLQQQTICSRISILSVRGQVTRNILLSKGIDCPSNYGDPALLLPYIYRPENISRLKIGIIPHFEELNSPIIQLLRNNPNYLIIDLTKYNKWTDIIDQINSCTSIYSSSLHGLIVADAYNIPNSFISFGDIDNRNNYMKYRDYFSSINRDFYGPKYISDITDIYNLSPDSNKYLPLNIDVKSLIKSSPFKCYFRYYEN